jgi:hypothetical protein
MNGITKFVPEEIQLELLGPWYAQRPEDTRTLELFDASPKYPFAVTRFVDRAQRIVVNFDFKGDTYRSEIVPAQIKDSKTGLERLVFPGNREDLVERALRYIGVQQIAPVRLTADSRRQAVTVFFTLSMIRRHLEEVGHGFTIAEIREALDILSGTRLEIFAPITLDVGNTWSRGRDDSRFIKASILSNYTGDFPEEDSTGEFSWAAMTFHPLVTEAILQMGYYPMNALRVGKLKGPLARALATRMSHNFRMAQKPHRDKDKMIWVERNSYHIALTRMIAERMMVPEARFRNSLAKAREAIGELKAGNFLYPEHPYDEKVISTPTTRRPKIVDAVWDLFPSDEFTQEIIQGNAEMAEKRREAGRGK